jgi:hypothetical protein
MGAGGRALCGAGGPVNGYTSTAQACRDCKRLRAEGAPQAPTLNPYRLPPPPPHTRHYTDKQQGDTRLLVRMPTRSRPAQALDVLTKYRKLAGCDISIEVVIDDDDATMQSRDMWYRLGLLGCTITSGVHKSKIEAVNGGKVDDWDVLLLASDDMIPVAQGYAVRVLKAMGEYFPYFDGALYFNDSYAGKSLCTLPIIGRRFYNQWGYVYEPEYKSFFCDNEQHEVWTAMNRLVYIDEVLIQHKHYANKDPKLKAPNDSLYQKNQAAWNSDEAIYKRRKGANFHMPKMLLSICIATVPSRAALLDEILAELTKQISQFPREVEIVIDPRERVTIGAKRNDLIRRAIGEYVAHVDDDDKIAPDYISRVLHALKSNPGTDCASLAGIMTTDDQDPVPFLDSIRYGQWSTKPNSDGLYERTPEHRNAVRRDLAIKAGFPDSSYGEDHEFSRRLRPLLKTEAWTGDEPLYFYNYRSGKPYGWYYGANR